MQLDNLELLEIGEIMETLGLQVSPEHQGPLVLWEPLGQLEVRGPSERLEVSGLLDLLEQLEI